MDEDSIEEIDDLTDGELKEATEPEPQSEPEPDSLYEVAAQVRRGEWGIGQERRRRLAEAGHDHRAVQAELVRQANS